MPPLVLLRIMKMAIIIAEVAQVVWITANIIGKHRHGTTQIRYRPKN